MNPSLFDIERFQVEPELQIRNQREDLIHQIVEATTEKDKKKLARVLAIASNTGKWSNTDLHALLKKQGEVRNFTAFVWWSVKIKTDNK